jgi:hypothetical protein
MEELDNDDLELRSRQNDSECLERYLVMKYLYESCLSDEDFINTVEWVIGKDLKVIE